MRPWILLAGANGAMAIGMAAYGSHGVSPEVAPLMQVASQFQLIHAVALLAVDRLGLQGSRLAALAGGFITLGVLLFSGSLYLKALIGPLPVPLVTPAGGISLLVGWVVIFLAGVVGRSPR